MNWLEGFHRSSLAHCHSNLGKEIEAKNKKRSHVPLSDDKAGAVETFIAKETEKPRTRSVMSAYVLKLSVRSLKLFCSRN